MIHPRIRDALSPHSHFYYVLWPIIVEQADWHTRTNLLLVNHELNKLCYPFRRSDRAKGYYSRLARDRHWRHPFYPINLSMDEEWLCFSVSRCGFISIHSFRRFCELGDIDPTSSVQCCPDESQILLEQRREREEKAKERGVPGTSANSTSTTAATRYLQRELAALEDQAAILRNSQFSWRSRSGDLIMDMNSESPPMAADGSFHHVASDLGVIGPRDRVLAMYNFVFDNLLGSRRTAQGEDEMDLDEVDEEDDDEEEEMRDVWTDVEGENSDESEEEDEDMDDNDVLEGQHDDGGQHTRDDRYGVYWRRISWDRGYF